MEEGEDDGEADEDKVKEEKDSTAVSSYLFSSLGIQLKPYIAHRE